MKDNNCIICKIANGEIPSATLYDDEKVRVILDISPASKGHALILPKEHYANLYEISDEMAMHVIKTAKKMAIKMKDELGLEGLNVLQNNGEAAGQTVFHYHMHLVPRYKEDKVNMKWENGELGEELKEELVRKLSFESGI